MKNFLKLTFLLITTLSLNNGLSRMLNRTNKFNFSNENLKYKNQTPADTDISVNIGYNYIGSFYKTTKEESYVYKTIKWTDYASDWDSFKRTYSTFTLLGILVGGFEGWDAIQTNTLGSNYTYRLDIPNNGYQIANSISSTVYTYLFLQLWKDGESISFKWEAFLKGNINNVIVIKLEKITFHKKL